MPIKVEQNLPKTAEPFIEEGWFFKAENGDLMFIGYPYQLALIIKGVAAISDDGEFVTTGFDLTPNK